MAITSAPVSFTVLNTILKEDAAGTSDAAIATILNAAGHEVPREIPTNYRSYRHSHGYVVSNPAGPDHHKWSADAVAAVIASTEIASVIAGTTDRASLGGSEQLTIA